MLKSASLPPARMSDNILETYMNTVFQCTPRRDRGTAPAEEWWQLLSVINVHENHYMLTQEEIDALEPYCLNNPEMEMTPQDFVRLISMVRYTDSDIQEVEITPQMSISASMRANTINYYDGESVHHPEPHFDDIMEDDRRVPPYESIHHLEEVRRLKKDKSDLLLQLKENDNKIQEMAKVHLERISQLETKIQYLNIEKERQKSLTSEHLQKERERLDKIAELQNNAKNIEEKHSTCSKKLIKKEEEVTKLQERLKQTEKELNQTKESTKNKELELRQVVDENIKLMEIIDKQKFDLDEARSGLNHFYSNGKDQNELEAEYIEKLNQTKRERDIFKQQAEASETQIRYLSNQLDQHHQITNDIKSHIHSAHSIFLNPFIQFISYIAWIFLFYHLFLVIFAYLTNQTPLDPILNKLDFWLYYHFVKT
ncbi:hypothetical protein G6F43_005714 [Rhizopus delemar]|nr:hypothetical protein G6F43_005714 [Rhizopus delemar]